MTFTKKAAICRHGSRKEVFSSATRRWNIQKKTSDRLAAKLKGKIMKEIIKLLNPDNTVTLNRPLAHALGTNEAIIYAALIGKQAYYEQNAMLDANGWFYSTIADLQESTGLSRYQQNRAIKTLVDAGLVMCCKKGLPSKRYFIVSSDKELLEKIIKDGEDKMTALNGIAQRTCKQVCEKATNLSAANLTTSLQETDIHTINLNNKSRVINPNQSISRGTDMDDRIKCGKSVCSSDEREDLRQLICENIEYSYITEKGKKQVDEIVSIMIDVLCSGRDTVRVNGGEIPLETVRSRFLKLDSGHIEYVLETMSRNTTDIRNIRAYLITALYNAPVTVDNYYTALVNHDMHQSTA